MLDNELEDVLTKVSNSFSDAIKAMKKAHVPLEEIVKFIHEFEERIEMMFLPSEKNKHSIYFMHPPETREFVSKLGEALKAQGDEITGRTFWERKYTMSSEEAARFAEQANCYLKEIDRLSPMKMERRLFLSYAKEDFQDVLRFAKSLNVELAFMGGTTWLDREDVIDDENWINEVLTALTYCCGVVVLLSRYSINSPAVAREISFTLERLKRRSGIFFSIALLEKLDVGKFFSRDVPVINLYQMESDRAARNLARKMVAFHAKYARSLEDNKGG